MPEAEEEDVIRQIHQAQEELEEPEMELTELIMQQEAILILVEVVAVIAPRLEQLKLEATAAPASWR